MVREIFDVIILGAGVTGLVSALRTARAGHKVCVVEDYPSPGGNHISTEINGASFDIGAIFFWSDNFIFDLFPELKRDCVPVKHHISRINPDGAVAAYPYSIRDEFFRMRPREIGRSALDLLAAKYRHRKFQTADDYLKYYLGAYLAERSGINYFIQRFYGASADEISSALAQKRMGWIATNASLRNRFKRALSFARPRRQGEAPTCLARPRCGFGAMYKSAVDALRASGCEVILNASVRDIHYAKDQYQVHLASRAISGKRLISTYPLDKVSSLLGLRDVVPPASTKMLTLFCEFEGARGFDSVILYNFHRSGLWKRLTMHSDYYGKVEGKEYFSVEVTFRRDPLPDSAAFEDFLAHVRRVGLFDGDVKLVGSRLTDFAYPLYELGAEVRKNATMKAIRSLGVDLVGRQGAFDYIPAADIAAREAIKMVDEAYAAPV